MSGLNYSSYDQTQPTTQDRPTIPRIMKLKSDHVLNATVFKEPVTDRLADINDAAMEALKLGPIYFAIHKVWKHFFIGLVLIPLSVGISWFVYTAFAEKIMRNYLTFKGWTPIPQEKAREKSYFLILLCANLWGVVLMALLAYLGIVLNS